MQKKQENYITTAELAKMLGISRVSAAKRVTKLIKEGAVTAAERGKGYIIDKDSLPDEIKDEIRKQQEEAAKKITELGKKAGHDLEFEKELWKAADKLRGSIDASEYKHIVLGLLFLKYVSDSYYQRRWQLEQWTSDPKNKDYFIKNEAERKHIIGDKDQYKSTGVFYIPEKSRWEQLRNHAMHHDIGKYIDEAMEAIEDENPKELKGVLPKIYAKTTLDYQILGELVNIFSKITFDHDIDKEKDILGRVYEYFLGQFASAEGKRGGEFYTPRSIVRLLVEVLSPYENARVFDPACGSGGMFVQSSEFLKMHQKDPTKISFFGQESNPTTLRLCKMNLAIRGIIGQMEIGNSYYDDKFPDLRADFVLANPPFNADWEPGRLSDKDPRVKFGTPPGGNANFLWIQHFVHHLSPNGMAGFVMANGALAVGGREGEIRRKIIEEDLIDVIIACPPKLFYNVALPVSLWFVSKNKKNGRFRDRTGETLFIDANETFEAISRKQVVFNNEHIQKITGVIRSWRGEKGAGEYKDITGFCRAARKDEIAKKGYILTPGRYVGIAAEENDGVSFEEKKIKLSNEITATFEKSDELRRRITTNLVSFIAKTNTGTNAIVWRKVKLGEVADVQWGDTNTTKAAYKPSGYLAFSATGPDGFMDHYDFDRDGVVLGAIGANCGETWFVHGKWSCIKNTIRFWGIEGKADTRFLFYVTHNKKIWPIRGSAQPFISQTDAQNMEILLPSYTEQKRIVDFLSPFDEKMEVNQVEDKNLIAFRNLLISRLMNGEIKI